MSVGLWGLPILSKALLRVEFMANTLLHSHPLLFVSAHTPTCTPFSTRTGVSNSCLRHILTLGIAGGLMAKWLQKQEMAS